MTAEHFTFWLFCILGVIWSLYLLVTACMDVKRRRPWWREPRRGDVIEFRRKLR